MKARRQYQARQGFTLIEVLIVVLISGILITALTATINGVFASARETRTIATLQKIDGLLADRQKGLELSLIHI